MNFSVNFFVNTVKHLQNDVTSLSFPVSFHFLLVYPTAIKLKMVISNVEVGKFQTSEVGKHGTSENGKYRTNEV